MSKNKTLYYRETDPNTGKAKWVVFDGIRGNGNYLTIDLDLLEEFLPRYSIPSNVVYKSIQGKNRRNK